MKQSYVIGVLLTVTLIGAAGLMTSRIISKSASNGRVVEIKSVDEFDGHLKNNKVTVVKYFAPWCSFCKKIAPAYDKLASEYPQANLIKVDFTKEHGKKLAEKAGVGGFPTFHIYERGKKVDEVIGADEAGLREKISKRAV